ncbi:MAG: Asp-tRNA(Asn)/Glu-tRNA(Gln) amidotransferase subunit GatB, partial [Candidatus Omnitrophica bacterium]|nr:Asp-tRNA(Asn)/Glu-tRNA(Gln) amidotransferase subunit GatB [Candidatus Omnitrophota bacterium]
MGYETVIGLEVHAQLRTASKIFCGCSTQFGDEPNSNTCPVCLGLPGSLPVLNQKTLEYAITVGCALNCTIAERLKFDRKNYFYPDLPKAYQISQYDMPVASGGHISIETDEGEKKIGITRAHLEEDAGKLLHEGIKDGTFVDYNRAGTPLLEIVSEPDLRTPQEAYTYLTMLKAILEYLEVSDCNMEEGSLRCDANISIRSKGEKSLGTKVEIKNLNSFKAVAHALEYEIKRQTDLIENGETIVQQTRLWNEAKGVTILMRGKEEAHDYRYFPEPDLVPFTLSHKEVSAIEKKLPELPHEKKQRFLNEYGLSSYDATVLIQSKIMANFFESCVKAGCEAKQVANWIQGELLGSMNARNMSWETLPLSPEVFVALLKLIEEGSISGKIAKEVLPQMLDSGKSAATIVQEKSL